MGLYRYNSLNVVISDLDGTDFSDYRKKASAELFRGRGGFFERDVIFSSFVLLCKPYLHLLFPHYIFSCKAIFPKFL